MPVNEPLVAFIRSVNPCFLTSTFVYYLQYNFETLSGSSVDRETFMLVLVDLQALHIRASYYTVVEEVR